MLIPFCRNFIAAHFLIVLALATWAALVVSAPPAHLLRHRVKVHDGRRKPPPYNQLAIVAAVQRANPAALWTSQVYPRFHGASVSYLRTQAADVITDMDDFVVGGGVGDGNGGLHTNPPSTSSSSPSPSPSPSSSSSSFTPLPKQLTLCGTDNTPPCKPLPSAFDGRQAWGKMCPSVRAVRDQGACGSSWAVAAVECMTDRICIQSSGTVA